MTDVSLNRDESTTAVKKAYKKTPKQGNSHSNSSKVHDDDREIVEEIRASKASKYSGHAVDSRHSLNRDGED